MSDETFPTRRGLLSLLLGAGAMLAGVGDAEAKRHRRWRRRKPHPHYAHPHRPHPHRLHPHPAHAQGARSKHPGETRATFDSPPEAGAGVAPLAIERPGFGPIHNGSGGGGGGGGGGWSDRRLKRDIVRLGASPSGLPIYAFQYVWGGPRFVGVMAQDLLRLRPDAVRLDESGYYKVDYARIDVEMREEAAAYV
jgi:hypothetical protein